MMEIIIAKARGNRKEKMNLQTVTTEEQRKGRRRRGKVGEESGDNDDEGRSK